MPDEKLTVGESWLLGSMRRHGFNLVDVLAAERGWNPLVDGEEMTITIYDSTNQINRRYVIRREDTDD